MPTETLPYSGIRTEVREHLVDLLGPYREQLKASALAGIKVEEPKSAEHGDLATNVAMVVAKQVGQNPRQFAEAVRDQLGRQGLYEAIEIAGPGFVNLRFSWAGLQQRLTQLLAAGDAFGRSDVGHGERVLLEYVSPNPTGPLHIGHARWAALGSAVANLLGWAGYAVWQECYVNDAGNQMALLGQSVAARYAELVGRPELVPLPEDGYQGDYIKDVARAAQEDPQIGPRLKTLLADSAAFAAEAPVLLRRFAEARLIGQQQETLGRLGTHFDRWFSERSLHESDQVRQVVELLQAAGEAEEEDGALWFRTTRYGDDKDRVLRKATGEYTYLAPDIAYHWDKLSRADRLIDMLGADHHGYTKRIKAAAAVLPSLAERLGKLAADVPGATALVLADRFRGLPPEQAAERLEVLIGQLVALFRNGEPVRMSKRTGEMITLDELLDEVGPDAARFFLVMRSADTPLDFDLDLAKKESADNPVFYVQYAHARISSILRLAAEQGFDAEAAPGEADLAALEHPAERALLLKLLAFPDEVAAAALAREPHRIARYAQELATEFHAFYRDCRVLDPDAPTRTRGRLALARAARQVLRNALTGVLGVSAPDRM